MSSLGIRSNNLFLGRLELQRLQSFIQDEGYQKFIRENAINFGLIDNAVDGNFLNGRVIEGTGDNTIRYNEILGIDTDGKFFYKEAIGQDISVGSTGADTAWYWVKLIRAESQIETGTISISSTGVLTGGTNFLTTLRGKVTDFPTKITFPNSSLNTSEYEVLSVTNDTTAQLNVVSMSAESDQNWRIIPTNTPGSVLTTDEKKLFNFDSATISLVAETVAETPPTSNAGEYWLARIRNSGTDVEIQDKRSNYIFKTVDGYFTSNLSRLANPLIGVEAIKFQALTEPRSRNIVELAWGMRSTNWSYDATANRVTIIAGEGGKFKDTTYFTNGDFDGWRLYFKSGKYAIIYSSSISGSQINLTLNSLDPLELTDTAQQLLVVPDCSEIELFFTSSSTTPLSVSKFTFDINTDIARCELPVISTTSNYVVTYRNKHLKDYSAILTIPNDSVGYYTEASFNSDGSLKTLLDRVRTTVTGGTGTITLTQATNAYSQRISSIDLGDKNGVTTVVLDDDTVNNQLVVGTNTREQIYTGTVTLTENKRINIRTTGAINGNEFFLNFNCDVTLDGNEFQVVQEWDGSSPLGLSGSTNLILFDFNNLFNLEQAKNNKLLLRCIFDGTYWNVNIITTDEEVQYVDSSSSSSFVKIKNKILEIGDWNMDTTSLVNINHGISNFLNIVSSKVSIINDLSTVIVSLEGYNGIGFEKGTYSINSTSFVLDRTTGGIFDNTSYDSTSFNRGYIYITYIE